MKKATKYAQTLFIRKKLATDKRWALRALDVIYTRQTEDEQQVDRTKHSNHRGFTKNDARRLSLIAKSHMSGCELQPTEMDIVFHAIPKYSRQIRNLENFNEARLLEEMAR